MDRDEVLALQDELLANMERTGTPVVVLYGGPGSGKSTTRAKVFGELKTRGRNVEEATEFAKDLVWENAAGKLAFQPYIIAKQMWRLRRLEGKVEAIITDTSTLLSLIYGGPENGVSKKFSEWVIDDYCAQNTIDFWLDRDPNIDYNPSGRTQSNLEEALKADQEIKNLLENVGKPYVTVTVDKQHDTHVYEIADVIERILDLSTDSGLRPSGTSLHVWNDQDVVRAIVEERKDMELWEGGPPSETEVAQARERLSNLRRTGSALEAAINRFN